MCTVSLELCTEGTMPTYEANRLKSPQNPLVQVLGVGGDCAGRQEPDTRDGHQQLHILVVPGHLPKALLQDLDLLLHTFYNAKYHLE
jgi:hypothetical protein